jgi:hypothetical protein
MTATVISNLMTWQAFFPLPVSQRLAGKWCVPLVFYETSFLSISILSKETQSTPSVKNEGTHSLKEPRRKWHSCSLVNSKLEPRNSRRKIFSGSRWLVAGLPDGLFSNQKSQFGSIFDSLRLENVDIFYGRLEYLRTFGDFYDHLVHFVLMWYIFSGFGITCQEKSGNPGWLRCLRRTRHCLQRFRLTLGTTNWLWQAKCYVRL